MNNQNVLAAAPDHIADARKMVAPAVQENPLRYTNDGALAECPCCGSLDVGGAHDTVHCQSCGLTVMKPRPLQNAIDAWNTRTGRKHPAPAVQGEPVGWQPADELRFEYRHPKTGEAYTVSLSREEVVECTDQELFEKLTACFCECEPIGETYVVDCCCDEHAYQFELVAAPQPAEQQPAPDVKALVEALESLMKGYASLLEGGIDRVTHLSGDCDLIPDMLRNAREALATYREQGGGK